MKNCNQVKFWKFSYLAFQFATLYSIQYLFCLCFKRVTQCNIYYWIFFLKQTSIKNVTEILDMTEYQRRIHRQLQLVCWGSIANFKVLGLSLCCHILRTIYIRISRILAFLLNIINNSNNNNKDALTKLTAGSFCLRTCTLGSREKIWKRTRPFLVE